MGRHEANLIDGYLLIKCHTMKIQEKLNQWVHSMDGILEGE